MRLEVRANDQMSIWPGYWTWVNVRMLTDDGVVILSGKLRTRQLPALTALLLRPSLTDILETG